MQINKMRKTFQGDRIFLLSIRTNMKNPNQNKLLKLQQHSPPCPQTWLAGENDQQDNACLIPAQEIQAGAFLTSEGGEKRSKIESVSEVLSRGDTNPPTISSRLLFRCHNSKQGFPPPPAVEKRTRHSEEGQCKVGPSLILWFLFRSYKCFAKWDPLAPLTAVLRQ